MARSGRRCCRATLCNPGALRKHRCHPDGIRRSVRRVCDLPWWRPADQWQAISQWAPPACCLCHLHVRRGRSYASRRRDPRRCPDGKRRDLRIRSLPVRWQIRHSHAALFPRSSADSVARPTTATFCLESANVSPSRRPLCQSACKGDPHIALGSNVTRDEGLPAAPNRSRAAALPLEPRRPSKFTVASEVA